MSDVDAADSDKQHFFDVAERLVRSTDAAEQALFVDELARLTFDD